VQALRAWVLEWSLSSGGEGGSEEALFLVGGDLGLWVKLSFPGVLSFLWVFIHFHHFL
jgi:hypothetical protein